MIPDYRAKRVAPELADSSPQTTMTSAALAAALETASVIVDFIDEDVRATITCDSLGGIFFFGEPGQFERRVRNRFPRATDDDVALAVGWINDLIRQALRERPRRSPRPGNYATRWMDESRRNSYWTGS